MDLREALERLHTEVAEDLLERVRSGEATHQELLAAIQLLKHNNITVPPLAKDGSKLRKLVDAMPFQDDDDIACQA